MFAISNATISVVVLFVNLAVYRCSSPILSLDWLSLCEEDVLIRV